MELTKDEHTRNTLEFVFAPQEFDRPVLAPPGLPPERVALLRQAFAATMNDPALKAEAAKLRIEVDHVSGETLFTTVQRAFAMPPDVVAAAKEATGNIGGGGD